MNRPDESTPSAAQDDLERRSEQLEVAAQQLQRHGEFYPYALALETSGHQRTVAAAVLVTLEHADHLAPTVFLPNHRRRLTKTVTYATLQRGPASAHIWPAP